MKGSSHHISAKRSDKTPYGLTLHSIVHNEVKGADRLGKPRGETGQIPPQTVARATLRADKRRGGQDRELRVALCPLLGSGHGHLVSLSFGTEAS